MPELHIQLVDEQLEITFGEYRSTVAWADIASWKPEYVEKNAEAYGHRLFVQITQDASLRNALTCLRRNTRLVLVAEQPEVAAIPWEYLRLPEASGGLLLATRYNFVRGIPEGQRQDSIALDSSLTIVAVPVSAVDERIPLNTEGEWKNLSEKVRERNKVVTLQRVRPPTLAKMGSVLSSEGTNIVQFMGHSGIIDGKVVLVFEDELGRAKVITSAQFANTLDERTLLVVLNSCYSATAQGIASGAESVGTVSPLGNIARLVVHEGVSYALGMQFALPDNAALAITNALYDALLQGRSVEEAMRSMRASLEQDALLQNTHWLAGVPVLYTSLREPVSALKLTTGQPTLVPDPVRFAQSFDLSALSTPQHFFGRADAISETLEALQDTSKRGFVVLHGLGGIGKTTLARVVATRISWHYQDRVLAYSFETFARFAFEGDHTRTTVDVQFAARFYNKLATFYGLDPGQYKETRDLQDAIKQQRSHTRSLLILDNIETLIYAQNQGNNDALPLAAFMRDLQQGEGDILLTTREMLPSGWGDYKEIRLQGLNDDDGAELFLASIANDRKHAAPKKDRIALSNYVQGHPLCIRLLAGRFSDDKAGDLASFSKNLDGELGRSRQNTPTSPDDPTRHETLTACMDYSIRRLTPEQAKVLYTIGIFRAPFPLEFAENVLSDEEHRTEKYLQDLVRLGLLEYSHTYLEDNYSGLYELHPMLRLHIKSNVATLNSEIRQRYGQVYENLAKQARNIKGGYDNNASIRYLLRQSLPDCEEALEEEAVKPATRSSLAYHLAQSYGRMGQVKHALALYEQSRKTNEELGDMDAVAAIQGSKADLLVKQGRIQDAMDLFNQSLAISLEQGDVRKIAVTLSFVVNLLSQQGKAQEAMTLCQNIFKIYQKCGNKREMAITQGMMADLIRQQGRMQEAMSLYERALKTMQELGDVSGIAIMQNALSGLSWQQGKVQDARNFYEQSLKTAQELGNVGGMAMIQTNFSQQLWQERKYIQALTLIWQAYKSLPEHDFPRDIQIIQGYLVSFKKNFADEEQVFDMLWQQATSKLQPLWLNKVQVGSSANIMTLTEDEIAEISQAIKVLISTENLDEIQSAVETQQRVLFTPGTEQAFEQYIEQATINKNQRQVEIFGVFLAMLRECKTYGIEATFERIKSRS